MHSQRLSQHHEQKTFSKDNCYLCRENKRRSLAAYIRGKSRRSSCHEIHEEEEEKVEEEAGHSTPNIKENTSTDKQISKDTVKKSGPNA